MAILFYRTVRLSLGHVTGPATNWACGVPPQDKVNVCPTGTSGANALLRGTPIESDERHSITQRARTVRVTGGFAPKRKKKGQEK